MKWLRRGEEYKKGTLEEGEFPNDPFSLFEEWFDVQKKQGDFSFSHMVLSTVSEENEPESRVVLLKRFDSTGFVFFTDYKSRKGKSIESNPLVSLNFFSLMNERQVIIRGKCKKTPVVDSDAYFSTRPRASQIGSVISVQSAPLKDRPTLMEAYRKVSQKYKNKKIPRPKHWGGYLVSPSEIEFWQGRAYRLNDRILFSKTKKKWRYQRLCP